MKTYWDYSEKERAEMLEGGVRALLDVELMFLAKVYRPELIVEVREWFPGELSETETAIQPAQ